MKLPVAPFSKDISPEGFDSRALTILFKNLGVPENLADETAQRCIDVLKKRPNLCRLFITKRRRLAEKNLTYFIRQELAKISLQESAPSIVQNSQWWYPYYFKSSLGEITLLNPDNK